MQKPFRCVLFVSAIALATAVSAGASELRLTIANGRVTLVAQDVPVQQVLAEWARVGQTRIVNAEKLIGPAVTLQLVDVPERQALDILLRSASGYVAAPRPAESIGASRFDRIMILATSRPPAASASVAPQAFTRPNVMPQPQPVPDDDDGEPADQGPVPPPGMFPPGMMPPGAVPSGMVNPGSQPQQFPGVSQPPGQQQVPMTAPRPGMLPAPTPGAPGNPYQPYPQPQVRRPGGGGE